MAKVCRESRVSLLVFFFFLGKSESVVVIGYFNIRGFDRRNKISCLQESF